MNKYKSVVSSVIMMLVICGGICSYGLASDEESLISSGKDILFAWESMLSKGYIGVVQDKGGGWIARKHLWFPGTGSYDIKKSDSIVSPYVLIIKFKTRYLAGNGFSPKANGPYYNYFKRKIGFNTPEEALANCTNADFVALDGSQRKEDIYEIMLSYLYQDGAWVIGKGNENFMMFFDKNLTDGLNGKYFKDLLNVPVKR